MFMVDQYPMENRKSYRYNESIVIIKALIQIVLSISFNAQSNYRETCRKKYPVGNH